MKSKKSENLKPSVEEVYRMLQTQMESVMDAGNMKVIAFTSVIDCEQKSAHVCNVAKSMVLEDKKVLVIDCNVDKPKVHRYFGIEIADNESSQIIMEVPKVPRLSFVPSTGLLNTGKIKELIEKVKDEYDIILMDSPPAGMVNEGVKLSVIADGTVLVVQAGKTPKALSKQMKKVVDSLNITILGVILEK